MDEQAIERWHCQIHHGRRGRGFHYSATAIETALMFKRLFKLGCVLKVFIFQAPQFSAMNRASKEASLGSFEVNECGLSGRMESHRMGRAFSNHFKNTA